MRMKSSMEQAVYVLLLLMRVPKNSFLTSESISERLNVSPTYFKKLMRVLVQADLVKSTPGAKGGFSIAKSPGEITLYSIFQAVEGQATIYKGSQLYKSVFNIDEEENNEPCVLQSIMDDIENQWSEIMKGYTLETIMEKVKAIYELDEVDNWINNQINKMENLII